ncbi:MAG: signal peptidase [Bacteroidales bacterium]|nr:signal peptidase [Bacteroidales bacterium]
MKIKSLNILKVIVKLIKLILVVSISVIFGIFVKTYFINIFHVPTTSMQDLIMPHDYILVNKSKNQDFPTKGDVICFKLDEYSKKPLIKRCIATPNDTVIFNVENIIINGVGDSLMYSSGSHRMKINAVRYNSIDSNLFKMGKLVIPSEGSSVYIDLLNYKFYENIILRYEKQDIHEKDGEIFINESAASNYTFKYNYYFVMGDNRAYSIDSRHFGPIPESAIIGEATHVLFSWSKNNPFFIGRIFKKIQ